MVGSPSDGNDLEATAMAAADARLHLLGSLRLLDRDGRELTPRGRKARALIAVLALSDNGTVSRERVASLLWSRHGEEQARASLRQSLLEARRATEGAGTDLLRADRETIRLDLQRVWVDVRALRDGTDLVEGALREQLLPAIGRELLADLGLREDAFDDWLREERARFLEQTQRGLKRALEAVLASRDLAALENLADTLLRLEPSSETAYRELIRVAALRGDQALAQRRYQALKTTLARELGVTPGAATETLMADIAAGVVAPDRATAASANADDVAGNAAPASPAPAAGAVSSAHTETPQRPAGSRLLPVEREPLVMVLPFDCHDETRAYLGDGLAEDIITALSRFRGFGVLARATAFAYRGHDARTLVTDPGADYVLEGSLRFAGTRLRISAHLAECAGGREVWGERFDCSEDEIFDVQDEIVSRIASHLDHQLSYNELRRAHGAGAQTLRAYDFCLQGIVLNTEWKSDSDERSVRMFERAIELEPDYARPHACLAGVYTVRNILCPGYPDAAADRARARALAERAVHLDPHDARNQVNLGWCQMLTGEFAPAGEHFRLAVDANPNDANILITCALASGYLGEHAGNGDAVLALADRAIRLNPSHPPYYHAFRGSLQFLLGDYEAARETFDRVPDIFPDIHAWRAANHAQLGNRTEAKKEGRVFLDNVVECWAGDGPPAPGQVVDWFFEITPLKRAEDRARLAWGLHGAGLGASAERGRKGGGH